MVKCQRAILCFATKYRINVNRKRHMDKYAVNIYIYRPDMLCISGQHEVAFRSVQFTTSNNKNNNNKSIETYHSVVLVTLATWATVCLGRYSHRHYWFEQIRPVVVANAQMYRHVLAVSPVHDHEFRPSALAFWFVRLYSSEL